MILLHITDLEFPITLSREGKTYTLRYGLSESTGLTKEKAFEHLTGAIHHALECAGKIDEEEG